MVSAAAITDTTIRNVTFDASPYRQIDFIVRNSLDSEVAIGFRMSDNSWLYFVDDDGAPRPYMPNPAQPEYRWHRVPARSATGASRYFMLSQIPLNDGKFKAPFRDYLFTADILYRAVNTCDSMVGYQNERFREFGWASARLDDFLNWLPSRLTGMLILLGNKPRKMSHKEAWRIWFRDAKKHPSPNSGWLEAAVAAVLGVRLGGINYYQGKMSKRAVMGEPLMPLEKRHILLANGILVRTTVLFLLILWIGGIAVEMAGAWL
ncbi:MAG: cobalamin biosynthesis protein [Bacillales bacterium]